MPTQFFLVAGLASVFVAIALALSIIGAITAEKQAVGRSLAALEIRVPGVGLPPELHLPFADRVTLPLLRRLAALGRRLTPTGQAQRMRQRLERAGSPEGWDVDRVLAVKMLGLFVGVIVGLAVPALLGASLLVALGVMLLVVAFGYLLPNVVLFDMTQRRAQRIQKDLPNAMDLLSVSVEAGLGFDAAVAQVARNTEGPLAEEFFRVLQEMQIGMGRVEAIRALGERSTVPDLRGFAAAMVQADSFGVPVVNVLRIQAKEMRVKRRQRAEEQAQKVPVKILFPLIFCILPTLFIVILGPAVLQILETFG